MPNGLTCMPDLPSILADVAVIEHLLVKYGFEL
jgi:hypothetical protein